MSGQDYTQLTLFQEDSRASLSASPGSGEAKTTTVISGRKCYELYGNYSPLGSLAKMLLGSSIWRSTRYWLTWKVSATPAKRLLFRLVASTPRTSESDVRSWPTLTAADTYTGNLQSSQRKPGSRHSLNLSNAVTRWPTPKARDFHSATGCERRESPDLNVAAKMISAGKGQLNPDWVELLMGFPGWMDEVVSKWNDDSWETAVPRITTESANRAARLKCLGNAVVPEQFYPIFKAIADYIIERDYTGREYPKFKQTARCGNAVSPPFAEALVRANLPEWCS